MNTHSTERITWYVNSGTMIEPLFRGKADATPVRRQEYVHTSSRRVHAHKEQPTIGSARPLDPEDEDDPGDKVVIVVLTDLSPGSLKAIQVAASIGKHTQGMLVFCHAIFPKVIPFGPAAPAWVTEALRDEALEKLQPALKTAEEAGVTAACAVEEGTPVGVILKVARRTAASLIVLTLREQSAWARLLFGPTVVEQVVREADCHLMVVRTEPK